MTVRRAMGYVGLVALACLPLTWLARAIGAAREAARSAQCISNLKQIGLGLLNYESKYGCFPPAYVADAKGKPLSFQLNDQTHPSVSSNHPARGSSYPGPHVLTVDDMVTIVPANLRPETLKALLTIDGGERIESKEWFLRR